MSTLLYVLCGYWVLQSLGIIWLIHTVVYKKLKYTELDYSRVSEDYAPFVRFDRKTWNVPLMYVLGVLFLPPRIFGVIFFLSCFVFIVHILGLGNLTDYRSELPPWKRAVVRFSCRFFMTLIMYCLGFYGVETVQKRVQDYDEEYPWKQYTARQGQPHAIQVSNHVSWIDINYFCTSRHVPSFLSKLDVAKYPLWGKSAKSLQCLFFSRENEKDRLGVLELIRQRADNILLHKKNYPPIHIFPEGTTSNGKCVIGFKRGAFEHFLPIKIFCLKYDVRNFYPSLDSIG